MNKSTLTKRLYCRLSRFFSRLAAIPIEKAPDGLPGIRDRDNRCHVFEPRKWQPGDFHDCLGDGHYLCKECAHFKWNDTAE